MYIFLDKNLNEISMFDDIAAAVGQVVSVQKYESWAEIGWNDVTIMYVSI